MWHPRQRQLVAIKAALFALCLAPFAHLVWGVAYDALGANPVEAVTHSTGWWTLFLLCATLAVTPLRRATGANWLQKLRRMLGLYAFFYATLHFITYIWLDQWFDLTAMAGDVLKRPYITVGLLLPLAIVSALLFGLAGSGGGLSVLVMGLILILLMLFQLMLFGTQYCAFRDIFGMVDEPAPAPGDDGQLLA